MLSFAVNTVGCTTLWSTWRYSGELFSAVEIVRSRRHNSNQYTCLQCFLHNQKATGLILNSH